MNRTSSIAVVIALVGASVAGPLGVYLQARTTAHKEAAAERQLDRQLDYMRAENERLSNAVANNTLPSLSPAQLRELLSLRAEVDALRAQTNAIRLLREENQRLESWPQGEASPALAPLGSDDSPELEAETIAAMKSIIEKLPSAMQQFAGAHGGKAPTSFSELREYFPTTNGRRMPGLYTFEFVRDEGPRPGDGLILRESGARHFPDGTSRRVYGFRNGNALEVTAPESDPDRFFGAWENQHLSSVAGDP